MKKIIVVLVVLLLLPLALAQDGETSSLGEASPTETKECVAINTSTQTLLNLEGVLKLCTPNINKGWTCGVREIETNNITNCESPTNYCYLKKCISYSEIPEDIKPETPSESSRDEIFGEIIKTDTYIGTCGDSDGFNKKKIGKIYFNSSILGRTPIFTDTCSLDRTLDATGPTGSYLLEGVCISKDKFVKKGGEFQVRSVKCNCQDGACVEPKTTKIKDSHPPVAPSIEKNDSETANTKKSKTAWLALITGLDMTIKGVEEMFLSIVFPLYNFFDGSFLVTFPGSGLFGNLEEKCKISYGNINEQMGIDLSISENQFLQNHETYYVVSGSNERYLCDFVDNEASENEDDVELDEVFRRPLGSSGTGDQNLRASEFSGYYKGIVKKAILDAIDKISAASEEDDNLVEVVTLDDGERYISFRRGVEDSNNFLWYNIEINSNGYIEKFFINTKRDENPRHLYIDIESSNDTWEQKFITANIQSFLYG